ncbi:phage holin family protein [Neisseria chenwenguii]|uniref:Uncharacterized protein n=1 Tax=Neisseria chenwenguii TaxID=1853278 RepID=A0A220RZK7_9NEIS|nr:phage holin family protein [Neisseria chenwenguii]ASK26661.1 hypothetical protein BG910_01895 [Neisseria chenwenguii]ROV56322.1 hypothetical protein EGS38_04705 [Neisseria chenwenguii]
MTIKQNLEYAKTLLNQGTDLLLLRAQMLHLDLAEQAEGAFKSAVWLAAAAVLSLVGLISLLFGLNRVLGDTAAVWVFFGLTAACLLTVSVTLRMVVTNWRRQSGRVAATLREIQDDIACLRGQGAADREGGRDE